MGNVRCKKVGSISFYVTAKVVNPGLESRLSPGAFLTFGFVILLLGVQAKYKKPPFAKVSETFYLSITLYEKLFKLFNFLPMNDKKSR